jgi:hypothetical protein
MTMTKIQMIFFREKAHRALLYIESNRTGISGVTSFTRLKYTK